MLFQLGEGRRPPLIGINVGRTILMAMPHIDAVERLGFAEIPDLLTEELRRELAVLFDGDEGRAGRRDGLAFQVVRAAATSGAVCAVVRAILGRSAFATKATLFDKTPSSVCRVPVLHKYLTGKRQVFRCEACGSRMGGQNVKPEPMLLPTLELAYSQ